VPVLWIEQQPVIAVVHGQQRFQHRPLNVPLQRDAVNEHGRNACPCQQCLRQPGAFQRRVCVGQEQADVFVGTGAAQAIEDFSCERFDISRFRPHFGYQVVQGTGPGLFQHRRRREIRRVVDTPLAGIRDDRGPVVQRLRVVQPADRPVRLATEQLLVERQPKAAGNEIFGADDKAAGSRRQQQTGPDGAFERFDFQSRLDDPLFAALVR
jgi:hypothetical protein